VKTIARGSATGAVAVCGSRVAVSETCVSGSPLSTQQQSLSAEQGPGEEDSKPRARSSAASSSPQQDARASCKSPVAQCPWPSPAQPQIGLKAARTGRGINSHTARRPWLARRVSMRLMSIPYEI